MDNQQVVNLTVDAPYACNSAIYGQRSSATGNISSYVTYIPNPLASSTDNVVVTNASATSTVVVANFPAVQQISATSAVPVSFTSSTISVEVATTSVGSLDTAPVVYGIGLVLFVLTLFGIMFTLKKK